MNNPAAGNSVAPPIPSPGDDAPAPARRPIGIGLILAVVLMAIFKLWLAGGDEIAARQSPLDDEWYLRSGKHWYWDRPYEWLAFVRPPGYPLFIAVNHLTGLPLRLTIEVLYLLGGAAVVLAVARAGQNRVLCALMFAAIALHPWSYDTFLHINTDTLYAVLLLFCVAGIIMVFAETQTRSRIVYALLTGLAFGWLWITREEHELVLAYLACATLLAIFFRPGKWLDWRRWLREIGIVAVLPMVVVIAIVLSVCAISYRTYGEFVTSEVRLPGFVAASRALLRIKPDQPIQYCAITRDMMEKSYAVSPAMAALKPLYEGPPGHAWETPTRDMMKLDGQIASPWFYWYFREAVALAGHGKSAQEADAYFQRIADEVNAACDHGRVASRPVFSSFIDPEAGRYLNQLPDSFFRLAALFDITGGGSYKDTDGVNRAPPQDVAIFNDMANRRPELLKPHEIAIHGWAFTPPADPIVRIEIRGQFRVLGSTTNFVPRPDVVKHFDKLTGVPASSGFAIVAPIGNEFRRDIEIAFITQNGQTIRLPAHVETSGEVQWLPMIGKDVRYHFDKLEVPPLPRATAEMLKNRICFVHGYVVKTLTPLGVLAGVVLMLRFMTQRMRKRPMDVADAGWTAMLFIGIVVAGRMALFTFIDTVTMPSETMPRYLFPIMPLYTCFLLMMIFKAVSWKRSKSPAAAQPPAELPPTWSVNQPITTSAV